MMGGLSGLYIGKQGQGIISGLKDYAGAGELKGTTAFFNQINLGEATGSKLLYNQALAGAIDWIVVSPAFTVGRSFWDTVKADIGYYDDIKGNLSKESAQVLDSARWYNPATWIKAGGKDANGKDVIAQITVRDIVQSAIEGPRSGVWMKPMIELLQARSDSPTWYNQGGLEKLANGVRRAVSGEAKFTQ